MKYLDNSTRLLVIRSAGKQAGSLSCSVWLFLWAEPITVRCELNVRFEATIEEVRQSYALTASQTYCPFHHKNARIDVAGETLDDLHVEVFACCEEFEKRIQDALRDRL